MEVSNTKLEFLNRLGIDLNNLPKEFDKFSKSYDYNSTSEEKDFLFSDSYTKTFVLPFSMKDIVGTQHPSYEDITFLEAFLKSKRGDWIIPMFYNNPNYYSETLKQKDQSKAPHDTPIELNRDSFGNCYIAGGNNRINLLMMIYLSELSKAKTEEEKELINDKYTFYAEIRSLPKNQEVYNTIFLLKDFYKGDIKFSFIGDNPDDCHYEIIIKDQILEITNANQLTDVLREAYNLSSVNSSSELYSKLFNLVVTYISVKSKGNNIKKQILLKVCPDLELLQRLFIELRRITVADNVFDGLDLSQINLTNICEVISDTIIRVQNNITEDLNINQLDDVPTSPKM